MSPDNRVTNGEGKPFGPILADMLRRESVILLRESSDDHCRRSVLFEMAASYIEAVVEGKGPRVSAWHRFLSLIGLR